jgi:hypothetical protein
MRDKQTRITAVSYGRTVNMGNYESVRFDLTAEVREDQDWYEVLDDLRKEALKLEKETKKQGY